MSLGSQLSLYPQKRLILAIILFLHCWRSPRPRAGYRAPFYGVGFGKWTSRVGSVRILVLSGAIWLPSQCSVMEHSAYQKFWEFILESHL